MLKRAGPAQAESIAAVLLECFRDDPLVCAQTRGIDDREKFLARLMRTQAEIYLQTRDVFISGNHALAVLIGGEHSRLQRMKSVLCGLRSVFSLQASVGKKQWRRYTHNVRTLAGVLDMNWPRRMIKGRYYHLEIIAISPEARGQGHLRQMLEPLFRQCDEKAMPMLLETVNVGQVGMYEHLGFEPILTLDGGDTGISLYCFIRKPASG